MATSPLRSFSSRRLSASRPIAQLIRANGTLLQLLAVVLYTASVLAGESHIILRPVSDLSRVTALENAGDASGRLFLGHIEGKIWILSAGELLPVPFLDLSDRVKLQGEGGLLGLAFHPEYAQNRRFFVSYTRAQDSAFQLVISEFKASQDEPNRALPTGRDILVIPQPTPRHQAGDIAFGPDGMLYVSSGDGGLTGAENTFSQDLSSRLGKILRLDVSSEEVPFAIPPDNPFAGEVDKEQTIWASGLRNPFRISFDPNTGRLFAGDVGEAHREEVNLIAKGGNYGWARAEGTLCHPRASAPCDLSDTLFPIYEYERQPGGGAAVIGGRVYRGGEPTPLWGQYFFAEFVEGGIWTLEETQQGWVPRQVGSAINPVTFGEDEEGKLYLADLRGVFAIDFLWREILPHLAAGIASQGELVSEILLSNPQDQDLDMAVVWLSGTGKPIEFELAGVPGFGENFSLPARSSTSLELRGPGGELTSGWAAVTGTAPFNVSIIYSLLNHPADEVPASRAWSGPSEEGQDFLVHFEKDSALGTDLALALGNPSTEELISIQILARDLKKRAVDQATIKILPLHRRALFVSNLLNLPETFAGTLQISSNHVFHPLAVLTLNQILDSALALTSPNGVGAQGQ